MYSHFLIGAKSGKQRGVSIQEEIEVAARECGLEYTLDSIEKPGQAKELARRSAEQGTHLIIAVGGDGLVNEVLNGMIESDAVFGVIPAGTGNGFAWSLEMPKDIREACQLFKEGNHISVGLGKVTHNDTTQYFANAFGLGLDASVVRDAAGRRGKLSRTLVYYLSGLKAYHRLRKGGKQIQVRGRSNGASFQHSCMMFDCVNSPRYSGFTSLVPTASLVDDVLDIIVVEYAGWWRLFGHLAASLADKLPQRPGVTTFQADEIILDSVQPPIAQLDGDPFTLKTPMKIEAAPDALKVIAPPSFTQKQSA